MFEAVQAKEVAVAALGYRSKRDFPEAATAFSFLGDLLVFPFGMVCWKRFPG
jgi:hypothetical protein